MTPTDPNPEPRFPLPRNLILWLAAVGGALLLIILIIVSVSRPAAPTITTVLTSTPSAAPEPGVDNAEAERRAVARAELQRFQQDAEDARRLLTEGEQALAAWDREVESELTGKRGRAVAADTEALARFSAVYSQPRTAKVELDACRERLATLLQPVAAALASGAVYVPSGDANSKLSAERQFAQSAQKTLHDIRRDALSVFAEAERKGPGGTQTLKEALADLELRQRKIRVDEITARQEAARREAVKLAAEARAEQELQYGRDEAARIAQETRRELDQHRALEARKDAEAVQLALVERAKDPSIRTKYRQFLDKGRFRPRPNGTSVRMETPGPMSYTDLKELGVFNDYKTFAKAGAGLWAGNTPGRIRLASEVAQNDRPTWPNPATEEDFDKYRPLFEEFRLLAPIWAKDGTLSP